MLNGTGAVPYVSSGPSTIAKSPVGGYLSAQDLIDAHELSIPRASNPALASASGLGASAAESIPAYDRIAHPLPSAALPELSTEATTSAPVVGDRGGFGPAGGTINIPITR